MDLYEQLKRNLQPKSQEPKRRFFYIKRSDETLRYLGEFTSTAEAGSQVEWLELDSAYLFDEETLKKWKKAAALWV